MIKRTTTNRLDELEERQRRDEQVRHDNEVRWDLLKRLAAVLVVIIHLILAK